MKNALVTLIIPTWKNHDFLIKCLNSLREQTYKNFRAIVVLNERKDRIIEVLERWPKLHVLVNEVNRGFCVAVNQGIRASSSKYIGVLNDDAFPEPGWLEALLEAAERDSRIGSCASLMVFAHRPDIVQGAGIAIDRAAISWDRWQGRKVEEAKTSGAVFGASAGAALYRREMLEQLGGFDERFFAYLEDVDLAWRADIAGWRSVYVPQAVVRHVASATLGRGSALQRWLLGRNKIWMVVKNAPIDDLPIILAYDLAAVVYALVRWRDSISLRGRMEGYRRLKAFLADRRPGRPSILEPLVPPWKVPGRFISF